MRPKLNVLSRSGLLCAIALSATANAETGRLPAGVTPIAYDITVAPDAAKLTFTGEETITVDVAAPTRTLTLNAADLSISEAMLDGSIAGAVTVDAAAQTASFTFAQPVTKGRHTLKLSFAGKINQSASGLFAVDYKGMDGKDARLLVTQFEAPDARRFAPMWDEPGLKATFKLSAIAPSGQTAFSNMQVTSKQAVPGGTLWHFAETPKMSSYLLFLGMGDVERKAVMAGKTEIGIITRKGAVDQGDYSLASAQKLLAYFNDYFGTPYPLPKLDMIAAPGSSQFFGAMENWGAILYFERTVLLDPKLQTEAQKQDVFNTVAHEMAHQWFGDLVTMSWWDDLWLNEGYASWMASKAADDLNPEWKALTQSLSGARQGAFSLDARATTHPIIQRIATVDQISQAFDNITYRKGEAVIRMLEASVGADAFRDGVRRYMAKHAYGNTVTDQLWAEVAAASGKPVAPMMHSFTLQGGVPLIRVGAPKCVAGKTALSLSQDRFALDAGSRKAQRWIVPVQLARGNAATTVMVSGAKPVAASIAGCGPVVVNAGQSAYFRTLYTPQHLTALTKGYAALPLDDQVGIAADSYALAAGGYQPFDRLFALMEATPVDASPLLWAYFTDRLGGIDETMKGSPEQAAYRKRAAAILQPLFARTGWEAKPGDASAVALLRATLIPTLGHLGDAGIAADAARYAEASLAPDSQVTGSIREAALGIWAYQADEAQWNALHERARTETGPVARLQYYRLLGSAKDPKLAERALALALTDEAPVPMRATLIAAVGGQHPALAFDWAVAHADQVNALLEQSSKTGFIVELASESSDRAVAGRVQAYALKAIPANSRADANATISRINYLANLRQRLAPAIGTWSKAR
jgi:aminopeptidase N